MQKSSSHSRIVRPGLWAKRVQISDIKKRLKSKVYSLTAEEVRRERWPYHKAIIADLFEEGFLNSAQFLEDLMRIEGSMKLESRLSTDRQFILKLVSDLKHAEQITRKESKQGEAIETMLKLAKEIANAGSRESWIAEQFFLLALETSQKYRLDGGYLEAKIRYYYSKFLVDICKLYDSAVEYLKIAHDMATGKNWALNEKTNELLDKEIDHLLAVCLNTMFEIHRHSNPELSAELSKRALKYAVESGNNEVISKSYILCACKEIDSKNYEEALKFLTNAVTRAKMANSPDLICEGLLMRSYCLKWTEDIYRAESFAKQAKKTAEENDRFLFVGKASALLGEIALSRGKMDLAASNFMSAVETFSALKCYDLAIGASCSGAFAIAHQIIDPYIELVKKTSGVGSESAMKKLRLWKEHGVPFWEHTSDGEMTHQSHIEQ